MPGRSLARAIEHKLRLAAIQLRGAPSLIVLACPDSEAERAVAGLVRSRIEGDVAVTEVRLTANSRDGLSLSRHLASLPPPTQRSVVFAFGLDDLAEEDRATAINALNWGREQIRECGYSVVLWVRSHTPAELGRRAPDFYAWRSEAILLDIPQDPRHREEVIARLGPSDVPTANDLREQYLHYVAQACRWLEFQGLLQLRSILHLPLEDVFVPLLGTSAARPPRLRSRSSRTGSPAGDASPALEEEGASTWEPIVDAIRRHRRLVVLGDPGSGKSTVLRYLALVFAQGRTKARERVAIDEDRIPILLPLSSFVEARTTRRRLSLDSFLPTYFEHQGLHDLSAVPESALREGKALVLLDGLDQVLSHRDRVLVGEAVAGLATKYPDVRIVVTSRIAGYDAAILTGGFAAYTLAPLNDMAICQFVRQWSLAFEAARVDAAAKPSDAWRQRAERRAQALSKAVTSHVRVRQLASSPLMLTLLVLAHHQGVRLPHRRGELYRLCLEALAEAWNLVRSPSGRPIGIRLSQRRLDEQFVVRLLAPIAYWMHGNRPSGAIERRDLLAHLAELLSAHEGVDELEAGVLAQHVVGLVREQMGILVEKAPDTFSFLHLCFQEYLAARFLSERNDAFDRLRPLLHHPCWREVILLTAGALREDHATEFVGCILNASVSWRDLVGRVRELLSGRIHGEAILHVLGGLRDLLLGAQCLGDDAPLSPPLRADIRDALFAVWSSRPLRRLAEDVAETFVHLGESAVGDEVARFLLAYVRGASGHTLFDRLAAAALVRGWASRGEVEEWAAQVLLGNEDRLFLVFGVEDALRRLDASDTSLMRALLGAIRDRTGSEQARTRALSATGSAAVRDREVSQAVLSVAQDSDESPRVRAHAMWAIRRTGQVPADMVPMLRDIALDERGDPVLRGAAATTLACHQEIGPDMAQMLLEVAQDKEEEEELRYDLISSLAAVAERHDSVFLGLVQMAGDTDDDPAVRDGTVTVLAERFSNRDEAAGVLRRTMLDDHEDGTTRIYAAEGLCRRKDSVADATKGLIGMLARGDRFTRSLAAARLGEFGTASDTVRQALLEYAATKGDLYPALDALWAFTARRLADP